MDQYSNVSRGDCTTIQNRLEERIDGIEKRITKLETRMAEKDTQFAVINTKLTAILWGVGVLATAIIGVLVKFVFKM